MIRKPVSTSARVGHLGKDAVQTGQARIQMLFLMRFQSKRGADFPALKKVKQEQKIYIPLPDRQMIVIGAIIVMQMNLLEETTQMLQPDGQLGLRKTVLMPDI